MVVGRSPGPGSAPGARLLAAIYLFAVGGLAVLAVAPSASSFASALVAATGIAATASILAQFVTSGRFEWVSGRIGLDVTMGFHRIAGAGVLLFSLAHLLILPFRRGFDDPLALLNRLTGSLTSPGNLSGLVALALLALIVVWARRFRGRGLPYAGWRIAHGLGAVLAVCLVGDHLVRRGDLVLAPAPLAALAAMTLVAAAALAVIYVVRPRTAYGRGFAVETVRRRSPTVVELTLAAPDRERFRFRPGQFAWLAVRGEHTVRDNPFSIASTPGELPRLRFLIREIGDGTRAMIDLRAGSPVAVDGPHGTFVPDPEARAVVALAGGIGIAPILSILEDAAERGDRRPYRLAYAVRDADEIAVADRLDDLATRLALRTTLLVERGDGPPGAGEGRITAEVVASMMEGLDRGAVRSFVCGPPAMMDASVTLLMEAGVGADRITMERFDYDAARDPASLAIRNRMAGLVAAVAAAAVAAALLASF